MRIHPDLFYAKILLFGEYSVLLNSMGLSIPYTHFNGELNFIGDDKYTDRNFAKRSNRELFKFLNYLIDNSDKYDSLLDLRTFENDINKGLYFESSIPESYGLGSSGALCASVYKKYGINPIGNSKKLKNGEIIQLKNILAQLESGFHGKSSGLDPLNSYLKVPLLIYNQNEIEQVSLPGKKFGEDSAIFLINSQKSGNTEPLVRSFLKNCENKEFSTLMEQELIPMNNQCIQELVNGNADSFFAELSQLSKFQLTNFKSMIPENFLDLWTEGLSSQQFWLKLCGSGGGGYLLGFTRNYSTTKGLLLEKGYDIVTVYENEK
ncbi:GHMP family kinase ATP-binding protein [Labilibaculum euxinus]|uniref:mevalonate kinase n=1 Tax=Labilibaculum euxinus TaxID=2686357 RepID=A0A7M4D4P8_9BACT|nr:mevalonate kinase [Labilibaculum euxinus]MUP37627.1 mevalonate kinase [Labilibaculum euxinus]MVB06832.1 mevalonate kinase [Labilibaculum euxinus]